MYRLQNKGRGIGKGPRYLTGIQAAQHVNIDLHIHTNASDGSYSPFEILAFARKRRLGAIAITDHDTIDGVKAVSGSSEIDGIPFLTGVEITVQAPPEFNLSESLHLLGYGIRIDDAELALLLSTLQKARDERTPRILQRLDHLGMAISYEELASAFPGPQLGRPHIAQLLIRKGYVSSIDEAFDRYLGNGKAAYVDKYRISYDQAVRAIRHAGGLAVLAHPGLYDLPNEGLEPLIRRLKEGGLRGIEIYYPEHSKAQTDLYKSYAEKYALLSTGGTDFHGAATPGIDIGVGRGDFQVLYELYEKILQELSLNPHG
jgi:predicted metal-dependent phosphoesterase TrpH